MCQDSVLVVIAAGRGINARIGQKGRNHVLIYPNGYDKNTAKLGENGFRLLHLSKSISILATRNKGNENCRVQRV